MFVERVAGITLGLVTVLIVASAIGRYGFARPVPDAFDLSRLILGVAIAWGLASVAWHGTHIKVDLLAQADFRRRGAGMNAFAWLVLLAFTAVMTWKIWERVDGGDGRRRRDDGHAPAALAVLPRHLARPGRRRLHQHGASCGVSLRHGTDLGEFDGIDEQLIEDQKE